MGHESQTAGHGLGQWTSGSWVTPFDPLSAPKPTVDLTRSTTTKVTDNDVLMLINRLTTTTFKFYGHST